jgi:hypothetical protein
MLATPDMAIELRCALDPVAFAVERLGFHPDPWQADVLRLSDKNTLLNCSRQAGKSTTTAIIALHTAVYKPGSLTLLGSPSLRQSRELFVKMTDFLKRLEHPPELEEDNRLSVQLRNGSRVVSLPGTGETVRGFSAPDLIVEDEAAFVEDSFYRAVRPMLAVSGGRLILMSTPYGKRGHFHGAWRETDAWHRVEVPARDCPRITAAFLERESKALGDLWFRQEYQCEFADVIDSVFRMADIERALSDDVTPLFEMPPGEDDVKPLTIVENAA